MHGSSGCLGSTNKPKLISSVNEPLKGHPYCSSGALKPSVSEDFRTTSTCDMDNVAGRSHGSKSSISSLTSLHDTPGAGDSSNPTEFVNHGLILWNQTRKKWIGNKKPEKRRQQLREPRLSWNATYDSLLGSNRPFPKPIPLAEMIDFLVDIWEQEGMYD